MMKMNDLYIALIRAEEVCAREEWPTGLAVYYDPGSVSLETDETLSYCFLERLSTGRLTVCSRDDTDLRYELANRAIRLLDQERRRVDANLPDDWPHGIHPEMQHWAKMLFRLHYFKPDHRFIAGVLGRVRAGNVLTKKQIAAIQEIYQELGGVEGLRKRQHTLWRLMRLSEIDLEPKDRATVEQFIHFAQSTAGLRARKLPVIGALEEQYWKQRLQATIRRADQIAAMLERRPGCTGLLG